MKNFKFYLFVLASIVAFFLVGCTLTDDHIHEYGSWTIIKEPTMNETGLAGRVCVYGDTITESLPELSNKGVWTEHDVLATCEEDGEHYFTSVYGKVVVEVYEALGHVSATYEITKNPTLEEPGTALRTCVCNDTKVEISIPCYLDDIWGVVDFKASTCEEEGYIIYKSIYGEITETFEKTEHEDIVWAIEVKPTLDETGKANGVCVCGEKVTAIIPALSDTEVWRVVTEDLPTYNHSGKRVYSSVYGSVEIELAKKVAPYDGKTYHSFAFDVKDSNDESLFKMSKGTPETAWTNATVTFDENGFGFGEAYPFRGYTSIEMVDEETGEVAIYVYDIVTDSEGNNAKGDNYNVFKGYVDFETGIIVRSQTESFNYVHILTPYGKLENMNDSTYVSWEDTLAIKYTYNTTENIEILINNSKVYFDVESTVEANSVFDVEYYYYFLNNELVNSFAVNNEFTEVYLLDEKQGTYYSNSDVLEVSGFGQVKYTKDLVEESGVYYYLNESLSMMITSSLVNVFYELELNGDSSFNAVAPYVTITFDTNGLDNISEQSKNAQVAFDLPVAQNPEYTFKGWFTDEQCTISALDKNGKYLPVADATLYALWKQLVVINLVGVQEGDENVLRLGDGDVIGQFLPNYSIDLENYKIFKGWYLDQDFEESLPEDAFVGEEDTNITIYAKWDELPVYYGTFTGANIYSETSGGSSASNVVTIDENGKITGSRYSGVVESYNEETKVLTIKEPNSSVYYMLFDKELGVLAEGYYRWTNLTKGLEADRMVYAKDIEKGKSIVHYGVYSDDPTGMTYRFVELTHKGNKAIVLVTGKTIYSNVTIENTQGEALSVNSKDTNSIAKSKTLVVKDSNGKMVVGAAAQDVSFTKSSTKVKPLDAYFGTYTVGNSTVVLDGIGGITVDAMTGTYAIVTGTDYLFDVYLNNNTIYLRGNISEGVLTYTMPMATITFVVGDHTPVEEVNVNINVKVELPNVTEQGYVFNGWYIDEERTQLASEDFKIASDTTLYGKYSLPATLSINYVCPEIQDVQQVYSVGEMTKVEVPVRSGYLFAGWYTSEDYNSQNVWTNQALLEDATIFAKWEVAPFFVGNTYVISSEGTSSNGGTGSHSRTQKITINPDMTGVKGSYPLSSNWTVENVDKVNGTFTIVMGNSKYSVFYSEEEKLAVMTLSSSSSSLFKEILIFSGNETGNINSSRVKSSYIDNGFTRFVEYTDANSTVHKFVVKGGVVYFGVSVVDGFNQEVDYSKAYMSKSLILNIDMNNVFTYSFNGTKLVEAEVDNTKGTYTFADGQLVSDGLGNVVMTSTNEEFNAGEGTYTVVDGVLNVMTSKGFFEVTLDTNTATCTVNKPMVTITLNVNSKGSVEATTLNVNKNFECTLPLVTVLDNTYEFVGWYSDDAFTTLLENGVVTPTSDMTVYANVREVPAGLSMNNAKLIDFTSQMEVATKANETDKDHIKYYFKVVFDNAERLYIKGENAKHLGTTSGSGNMYTSYARYQVVKADNTVVKANSSFDSYNLSYVDLEAGTYYIVVDLGAYSTSRDAWGTFDMSFAISEHDSVESAVELAVGNSYTVQGIERTYTLIKITLEAGVSYKLKGGKSPNIYIDSTLTKEYSTKIYWAETEITIKSDVDATFYIRTYSNGAVYTFTQA